jgi:hypothetical protein
MRSDGDHVYEGVLGIERPIRSVRAVGPARRMLVGLVVGLCAWTALAGVARAAVPGTISTMFCILAGPTRGRAWSATAARGELRRLAAQAGVRRRFAPHQLRHAHAIETAHEGIQLPIVQRQLGHAHLGITSIYLQGIDTREIIDSVHHRRPPVIPASAGLRP